MYFFKVSLVGAQEPWMLLNQVRLHLTVILEFDIHGDVLLSLQT